MRFPVDSAVHRSQQQLDVVLAEEGEEVLRWSWFALDAIDVAPRCPLAPLLTDSRLDQLEVGAALVWPTTGVVEGHDHEPLAPPDLVHQPTSFVDLAKRGLSTLQFLS